MNIRIVLILVFVLKQIYEIITDYMELSHVNAELPENVRDVYDENEYRRFLSYQKDWRNLALLENAISFVLKLLFLIFNVYALVFYLFDGLNVYFQYFLTIFAFIIVMAPFSLPFSYYDTFHIEEKYGMNKTTKKTFFLDALKSDIVSLLLTSLLVFIIAYLFSHYGNAAILWVSIALIAFVLAASLLAIPFMRIFNKFTPLEDGELRTKLEDLCAKYGVRIKKIVVKDASRRTTKANAFCTGLGKKTISLDDNLVKEFTPDQIVAVFAHEFAHAREHHMLKMLPFSFLTLIITVIAIALTLNIPQLFQAFGFRDVNYFFALDAAGILMWPLTLVLSIISNHLSRKHEYQADVFAAREGYGEELIASLKKLTAESLSGINPHPWTVFTSYSHPTLSQRISAIRKIKNS